MAQGTFDHMGAWQKLRGHAFGAALRAIFQHVLEMFGLPALIISAIGIVSVATAAWFSTLPVHWIFVVSILAFAGVPTGMLALVRLGQLIKRTFSGRPGEKYWEWSNKHNEIAAAHRRGFYNLLDTAYENWQEGTNAPGDFYALLKNSEFPKNLPKSDREHLVKADFRQDLSMNGGHLLQFAEAIYPPDRRVNSTLFPADQFEELDISRQALSKFWNDTGRKFFDFKELSEEDLSPIFPTHAREIKLHTYLEYVLAVRLQADGPGKHWMFRLYAWAEENGRTT